MTISRIAAMWCVLALAGCQRDVARDLGPPAATFASQAQKANDTIPLGDVAKSQAGVVAQRVANTDITITYNRPVARGRTLFGGIVPYEQVWNPGADQATAIAITRAVRVNDHPLPAGKYSLWMIPRAASFTVIFSKAADVFHTPYPGEAQDVLRFDVRPGSGPAVETLTFDFPLVEGKDATLEFRWGTIVVPLKIQVP